MTPIFASLSALFAILAWTSWALNTQPSNKPEAQAGDVYAFVLPANGDKFDPFDESSGNWMVTIEKVIEVSGDHYKYQFSVIRPKDVERSDLVASARLSLLQHAQKISK